jgi:hypothetical protein
VPLQGVIGNHEGAIVFGGHNHYYAKASVSGTEHLTIGGGGAPLRTPDEGYPFILLTASEFHFCKRLFPRACITDPGRRLERAAAARGGGGGNRTTSTSSDCYRTTTIF